MLTRRCAQRGFRLRPSDLTTQIFAYALALAMAKTRVEVHAICVMSNHVHLIVTDVEGRLPELMRELNRPTAKALNASQGQWENLWAAEPYNEVALPTEDELLDKVAYVAANPVEAGLVESPSAWPGFIQWMPAEGTVAKPDVYFGKKAPDFATWRITAPSGMRWSDEELLTPTRVSLERRGWDTTMPSAFTRRATARAARPVVSVRSTTTPTGAATEHHAAAHYDPREHDLRRQCGHRAFRLRRQIGHRLRCQFGR